MLGAAPDERDWAWATEKSDARRTALDIKRTQKQTLIARFTATGDEVRGSMILQYSKSERVN